MIATSPVRAISISPWGRTMRSKLVDLVLRAGDLDRHRLARDVDDVRAEDLGELHDLGAALHRSGDPEKRHLPRDRVVGLHVPDLDHVDELVKLLGHLVDRMDGAVHRERDARDLRVLGRADGERVDVEPAPAEEARDSGENAGLVLDEEREDVLAAGEPRGDLQVLELDELRGAGFHQPTMSLAAAPAGNHREAVLGLRHPHVDENRPVGFERRPHRVPRARPCRRSACRSSRRPRRASPSRGSGPSRPSCSGRPRRAPATGGPCRSGRCSSGRPSRGCRGPPPSPSPGRP